MAQHNDLGIWGEQKAVQYLSDNGYHIKEQNYRWKKDEVDIIATHQELYIFVEVKTRTDTRIEQPEQTVTFAKQKRIIKVANFYLEQNNIENESRFDIITVTPKSNGYDLNHIIEAFMPQW
jgi:putative endonuclease